MSRPIFYKLYKDLDHKDTTLFGKFDLDPINGSKVEVIKPKVESFFTGHELNISDSKYIPRQQNDIDFIFPLLVVDLIILIVMLSLYRKQFFNTIFSIFSPKNYQQLEGKTSIITHPVSIVLFLAFITNIGLLMVDRFDVNLGVSYMETLPSIITISIFVAAYYIVKTLFIYLSGEIFNLSQIARVYIDFIFISLINYGIILSILLWFEVYLNIPIIFSISMVIWLIISLIRLAQTYLRIIPGSGYKVFHFFLYLCTVEILPLIVLGKLVMNVSEKA